MRIDIYNLLDGARHAAGTAVVVDVFRATSAVCYAFAAGAERVLPVAGLDDARKLRDERPEYVLMGERGCIMPEDFDFGNSPTELSEADLSGKTVVHSTSAGTKGLVAAMEAGADEVLTCAFVNMDAVVRYIKNASPELVTVAAMGRGGEVPAPEDKLCAMYLKNELEAVPNAFTVLPDFLRQSPSAEIFFGETALVPESDFDLCLRLDAFDFIVRASRLPSGQIALHREHSPAAA